MALTGTTTGDFEKSKFVESPTRSGEAAVEVVIGSNAVFVIGSGANTRPAVTNVSAVALAANTARKYASFSNHTNADIFIKLGSAAVVNQGILIPPDGIYEITLDKLFTGIVYAIKSTAASVNIDVFEGT